MGLVSDIGQDYRDIGNARAQGIANSGAIWGGTLAHLGQQVAAIPGQLQQQKLQQQEADYRTGELQARQQELQFRAQQQKAAQDAQAQVNQIMAGALTDGPDGTRVIDRAKIVQRMAASGVPLQVQQEQLKALDDIDSSLQKYTSAKNVHTAAVYRAVLASVPEDQPLPPEAALSAAAILKANDLATDEDVAKIGASLAGKSDARSVLKLLAHFGDNGKTIVIPRGGTLATETGQTLAVGQPEPITPTELALKAAGGDPVKAMELAKPPKAATETAAEMDAKAQALFTKQASGTRLTPAEAAELKGYIDRKTIGPEASAAAAADRQAKTIAQQIAQQARTQAFTEGQAGRKEYADKVAIPYQTALASAQTLRDTVAAAQSGNKVAANLQNLETAMAAIRAQGLNRINTTEIHVAADAGNLWDRVQSAFGKVAQGQPVDASLQKDILQFADILEKSATIKYQKGRDSLNKVYPGSQLPDESVGSTPTIKPKATLAPSGLSVTDPTGKVWNFKSRGAAEAFKRQIDGQ